jgi:glutathione S-transferase
LPTLVTIPFSHFCEKARWALDAAGLGYREEGHCPGFHRPAVRRVGGRSSVPVLVLDDGVVLGDSPLIVAYADANAEARCKLLPAGGSDREEALALERHLDFEFAPEVRRFAYFHLLPNRRETIGLFDVRTPGVERLALRVVFPLLRRFMKRFMNIDEATALESRDRLRRVLDGIDRRLSDGRPYLMGDRFGAVDIAFAAFASPLVLPRCHPALGPWLESFETPPEGGRATAQAQDGRQGSLPLPGPFASEVSRTRETPAGRFAMRLYERRRLASPDAPH